MADEKITIIIPVLNDVEALKTLLPALQLYRQQGHEILLVDGGSVDASVSFSRALADRILMTGTGRGRQMNLGAENARHNLLLFLHADSKLPDDAVTKIVHALSLSDKHWGRFNVCFDQKGFAYSVIATMMNLRSRLTGVATGDQGIFVKHDSFHGVTGFRPIPLMEDIALSKSLRRLSWPVCLSSKIQTSARRWQSQGIMKTILLMWWLRLAFFIGVSPQRLADMYYPAGSMADPEK
jgi:rSAM/selenodomain-associated transferase 2